MTIAMKFYAVYDRFPEDPERSSNGGDYAYGRTIAVNESGVPCGVRFWTSADFDYCPLCGRFEVGCDCESEFSLTDAAGWEVSELLVGEDANLAAHRYETGGFAV